MFKLNEIRELIRLLDDSTVSEFNYELEGIRLLIKKAEADATVIPQVIQVAPAPVVQVPAVASASETMAQVAVAMAPSQEAPAAPAPTTGVVNDANVHKVISPIVGTLYSAPAPDAAPYVKVGQRVNEKTIVCIVEAMKLMNEIEADVNGKIVEVLVNNGQLVEYGQPLFLVKVD